jgi:protein TonB
MADIETLPPPPTKPPAAEPNPGRDTASPVTTAPAPSFSFGEVKDEGGVFQSLIATVRDTFFPEKLPPLVLESKPIAVPDRMATKMSPTSVAGSIAFYALLILLFALLIRNHVQLSAPTQKVIVLSAPAPPPPVAKITEKMGGGGGQHDLAPVTQGRLPKFAQEQIVPPKAPPTIPPKLAVDPTLVMQKDLKMANNTMPNLGMPNSTLPGVSLGTGSGGGIGSGNGNGLGPGSGGNMGGGVMHAGSAQVGPKLIYQVEPEFSEEARKAKFSGDVQVYLVVDAEGRPTHIRVARGVGMGLDEKAVEAVRQYKFKPALQNGKPVPVDLYIDVNFQIF